MITQKVLGGRWLYLFLVFTTIPMLVSCGDDNGTGPDPDNEITKTVVVKDKETEETLSSVTFEIQGEIVESNASKITLTRKKGAAVRVNVSKDGYVSTNGDVNFATDENNTVAIFMTKDNPDKVDIDYEIEDTQGSLIQDAEGYIAGTDTTVGGAEGTFTLPYSEDSIELCGRAEYREDACEELSLDQDHSDVVIILEEAEEVSVAVSVSDEETGEAVDEPTIKVGDYTYTSGEMSHSFPARDGDRSVFVTAEGYDTTKTSITADESHDLDISLVDLPECSDGINNDGVDGTDEEDPGCTNQDGEYDPQDDNETLRIRQITLGSNAGGEIISVSGAEDEQELVIIPRQVSDLDFSIIKASVSISVKFKVLVEENQAGEEFALRWETGSDDNNLTNTNVTEIVEDEGMNGEKDVQITIPKDYFPDGGSYEVTAVHATKVHGDPTTDGNDDVVFIKPDFEPSWVIEIEYQPEDVNDSEKAKMKTNDYEKVELFPPLE